MASDRPRTARMESGTVPGKNKLLKAGDMLFRSGDQSDGMFLIRRGQIEVFLEKDGGEISLAKMGAGAMLGEMALFDNNTRSASARAIEDTEVTHITTKEFDAIMKQIPKWFVKLMANLSSRLREMNAKLNSSAPAKGESSSAIAEMTRFLQLISLLFARYGEKENKNFLLQNAIIVDWASSFLNLSSSKVENVIDKLMDMGLFQSSRDMYNQPAISIASKARLERFVNFLIHFQKIMPNFESIPQPLFAMVKNIERSLRKSGFDQLTIKGETLLEEAEELGVEISSWKPYFEYLGLLDSTAIERVGHTKQILFKAGKSNLAPLIDNLNLLRSFQDTASKIKKSA